MSPSPGIRRQALSGRLLQSLRNWAAERGGWVLAAPTDLVLDPSNVVVPDLLFIAAARAAIVGANQILGAPDLMVGILSPSSRDRDLGAKRLAYEPFGVAEYWIVGPELETVKLYCQGTGGYGAATELRREADDALATPLLPGFRLPLAELFC